MKRLHFLLLILIITVIIAWMYFADPLSQLLNNDQIHYNDKSLGVSLVYPGSLTLTSRNDSVNLKHDLAFDNYGDCDMVEENKKYSRLTDFDLTIFVENNEISKTIQKYSSYIPEENFVQGIIKASPGFIDQYNNGKYTGYSIYEGAEGCGHTVYYLKVADNKTLVIRNKSIQVLSSARSDSEKKKVLNTPGIITPEVNAYYLDFIIKNLEVY